MCIRDRVGTAPGRGDILQAQSNADGSRRSFSDGNAGTATYMMLNAGTWPEGTYHIAVQAITPNGIGSAWSEETSFENHLVSPAFTASVNELSTADTLHIAPIYAREGANYQYNLQPDGRIAVSYTHLTHTDGEHAIPAMVCVGGRWQRTGKESRNVIRFHV